MAVQANAQGIVYAGLTDGHGMSVAYRPRGRAGYIPSYAECERGAGIGHKHRWNLHAIIGGNDRCRDMQRNNLWNEVRAWKHLFEIHSLPNEPLDVPHHILAHHIRDVAVKIRDSNACLSKGLLKFIRVLSWIFIVEMLIVTIVLSICAIVFSFGAGIVAVIAIVPTLISTAFSVLDSWAAGVLNTNIDLELKKNSLSLSLYKNNNELVKRGAKISNLLIWQPSAMFPLGSVYEQGKAGSESFCYTQAYDANKGILGTSEYSYFDELIQNRAQVSLAGGTQYMSSLLGFDFPLARVEIYDMQKEQLKLTNQCKEWQMRINSFVAALAKQGFFMASGNNSMSANKLYEHLINSHIKRRQKEFCTITMLNALKNYNKGLRYQNPMVMNDFASKHDTKQALLNTFDATYANFEAQLDTYQPLEAQALDFVDFAKQILAQVANFKNDSDKKLTLHLGSADFINARLKHSGDKAFSYTIKSTETYNPNFNREKPSFTLTIVQSGENGGDYLIGYDINAYAGSSPKIPPFVASNAFVVWGWVWKDIDLSKYFKAAEIKNAVYKEKDIYVQKLNFIDIGDGGSG